MPSSLVGHFLLYTDVYSNYFAREGGGDSVTRDRVIIINYTSTRRQAATSRAAQADLFTSEMKCSVFTSKSSLEFGEDVKKRLCLLSEVVLRTVKRRLTSSFPPFFWQKKWRRKFLSPPAILKGFLRKKLQNLAVKSNSENHFTFIQKNSESLLFAHIPVH